MKTAKYTGIILDIINKVRRFETCCRRKLEYREGQARPSYCYKFYWLEAIVNLISKGIQNTTFDEIIDEMICNAWYSVREFHIHLSGLQADRLVRDGVERAILQLTKLSDLPANASKVEIKNAVADHNEELKIYKEQLTNMVPGRALAGFFTKSNEVVPWGVCEICTS